MLAEELRHFDAGRAMLEDYLDGYPARLMVTDTELFQDALAAGHVAPDACLLSFERDGVLYAFPMTVVLSYNVIQGQIDDQPWMMTFCNACNTGMVFDPVINGQVLHFRRRGAYDGLLLIWDEETNSYWQHITGHCLYGSSLGHQLQQITTTRQINGAEAAAYPGKVLLLTSPLTDEQQKLSHVMEKMRAHPERLESGILSTLAQEDTRRPRFELGLGVWSASGSTFFPLETIYAHDSAFITEFEGRPILIYQQEDAIAPVAVYLDVQRAYWERDILRLDNGAYIQHDQYVAPDGQPKMLERPTQLLMRWYGFAMTFPGCKLPAV